MTSKDVVLLDCPFCGGVAETDSMQGYRAMSTGDIGHAAAVYCTGSCSAQMSLCYADVPDLPRERVLEVLIENWNRRRAVETPREQHTCDVHDHLLPDGTCTCHKKGDARNNAWEVYWAANFRQRGPGPSHRDTFMAGYTAGSSVEPTPAQQHYPEEWGPSDNRRLTCVCGDPDPGHMNLGSVKASEDPRMAEVREYMRQHRRGDRVPFGALAPRVAAAKLYREIHGCGLRQAVDACDAL